MKEKCNIGSLRTPSLCSLYRSGLSGETLSDWSTFDRANRWGETSNPRIEHPLRGVHIPVPGRGYCHPSRFSGRAPDRSGVPPDQRGETDSSNSPN
eukprot:scaffold843_cov330-Pavlova_lutheri.AAC.9